MSVSDESEVKNKSVCELVKYIKISNNDQYEKLCNDYIFLDLAVHGLIKFQELSLRDLTLLLTTYNFLEIDDSDLKLYINHLLNFPGNREYVENDENLNHINNLFN